MSLTKKQETCIDVEVGVPVKKVPLEVQHETAKSPSQFNIWKWLCFFLLIFSGFVSYQSYSNSKRELEFRRSYQSSIYAYQSKMTQICEKMQPFEFIVSEELSSYCFQRINDIKKPVEERDSDEVEEESKNCEDSSLDNDLNDSNDDDVDDYLNLYDSANDDDDDGLNVDDYDDYEDYDYGLSEDLLGPKSDDPSKNLPDSSKKDEADLEKKMKIITDEKSQESLSGNIDGKSIKEDDLNKNPNIGEVDKDKINAKVITKNDTNGAQATTTKTTLATTTTTTTLATTATTKTASATTQLDDFIFYQRLKPLDTYDDWYPSKITNITMRLVPNLEIMKLYKDNQGPYNAGSSTIWMEQKQSSEAASYFSLKNGNDVEVIKEGVYRINAKMTFRRGGGSSKMEFAIIKNYNEELRCRIIDDNFVDDLGDSLEEDSFAPYAPQLQQRLCSTDLTLALKPWDMIKIECRKGCKKVIYDPELTYWEITTSER